MNRRTFCCNALAFSAAPLVAGAQSAAPLGEAHALWSLLIPEIESQPGKGYLLARETLKPDGLPYIQTGQPKTAIQKAIAATKQGLHNYETVVPENMRSPFLEAVEDASSRQTETVQIEQLRLSKPYRLLTHGEVQSYIDLSPHVTGPSWKQDAKAARYFKGWNELACVSLPYFDKSNTLALICGENLAGCYGSQWHFFLKTGPTWKKLAWDTESTCEVA